MENIIFSIEKFSLVNADYSIISEVANLYCSNMDEDERANLRDKILEKKLNLKLLSLSELISEFCLNEKKPALLDCTLLMQSIEDFRWDPRENYIYLSIIEYTYDFFKQDIFHALDKIKLCSSSNANHHFSEFFNRPKSLRSLRAMGLSAAKVERKIKFDTIKPPWLK